MSARSTELGNGQVEGRVAIDRLVPPFHVVADIGAGYSRFVNWAKFALPIAALLLLVLILNWPKLQSSRESFALTFSSIGEDESGTTGMVNARFVGTDGDKQPYVITAATASQSNSEADVIKLNELQADMTFGSGIWVTMKADKGIYYRIQNRLELVGLVDIFSDLGYEFHAGDTMVDLSKKLAESRHAVHGQGPLGALKANSFRITKKGKNLIFGGNVRLVIEPTDKR